MNKRVLVLLFTGLFVGMPFLLTAHATTVVYDHFDNGFLDPAWSITFQNAKGWDYTEFGTNLTVTDIDPTVVNPSGGGTWARVILSQDFTPLTDFDVDFDISWDEENSPEVLQELQIFLYDPDGNRVAYAAYADTGIGVSGYRGAGVGDERTGWHDWVGYSGEASITISRVDSDVNVKWNSDNIFSGIEESLLTRIDVQFLYYASTNLGSYFGTESLDLVRVEGTPVPEPSTVLLLGSGLIGLAGFRRKFRKR